MITAHRFIRKLRGGTQAHLIEADDGHFYAVKFTNNPQHRRILVNEWVAAALIRYLQIATPATQIVDVTVEFLGQNPEVHLRLGAKRIPVEPGRHFGSRYPGDPFKRAVYDFLPDALLERVANLNHFLAVYAADRWLGNADARQSIFFRARLKDAGSALAGERPGFVVEMMDHGYVFDGPHWAFRDSPLQGLYFRPLVYSSVRSLRDFEPWLDRIRYFPEEVIDDAYKQIPAAWLEGDVGSLEALFDKVVTRRKKVPDLIESARRTNRDPFPNWD